MALYRAAAESHTRRKKHTVKLIPTKIITQRHSENYPYENYHSTKIEETQRHSECENYRSKMAVDDVFHVSPAMAAQWRAGRGYNLLK